MQYKRTFFFLSIKLYGLESGVYTALDKAILFKGWVWGWGESAGVGGGECNNTTTLAQHDYMQICS